MASTHISKSIRFYLIRFLCVSKREAKEESGLDLLTLKNIGKIDFQFEHKMSETLECHLFCADSFAGEIQETEGLILHKIENISN